VHTRGPSLYERALLDTSNGNGDGTLQPEENYPLVYAKRLVVSGDFNSDGKNDLAAGLAMSTTVLLSK